MAKKPLSPRSDIEPLRTGLLDGLPSPEPKPLPPPLLPEIPPKVETPAPVEELPLWKPNRSFRSEGNFSRFRRAVDVAEELCHFAEDVKLHGEVGVDLLITNGEIHTIRRRLGGTQK